MLLGALALSLIDFRVRLFAPKHAGKAADHAAHGQVAFGIGEEDFSAAAAAVVPALEQGELIRIVF